jgi:acyl-CoA-dependent ceramide synthase
MRHVPYPPPYLLLIGETQTSKILNYLDSDLVIPYFVLFMGVWTYLRHYQNLRIILSILPLPSPFPDWVTAHLTTIYDNLATYILSPAISQVAKLSPAAGAFLTKAVYGPYTPALFSRVGPYQVNWVTQQYKCWISQWITFGLLAALQAVNIFWLFLIFRVLWRLARTWGAEKVDERSEYDSEEEEERAEELVKEKKAEAEMMNGKKTH